MYCENNRNKGKIVLDENWLENRKKIGKLINETVRFRMKVLASNDKNNELWLTLLV